MKIKLLIASDDMDYNEHLSNTLSNGYSDKATVSVCTSIEKLGDMLNEQKYDVALFESSFCESLDTADITLSLVLWAQDEDLNAIVPQSIEKICKYQRISVMFAEILEKYAKVSKSSPGNHRKKANITVSWSPSGGTGKTTVALALAELEVSKERQVLYLSLESFSGVPVYFDASGKSISVLFEMLEAKEGNVDVLAQSLLCRDSVSNIAYFCCPNSFDDMNILSVENISALISACSGLAEELVIDMSCLCDERARHIFGLADRLYIVSDGTSTAKTKLDQFLSNNNVFSQVKDKVILVANKGAVLDKLPAGEMISLPLVESMDEARVVKVLAASLNGVEKSINTSLRPTSRNPLRFSDGLGDCGSSPQ